MEHVREKADFGALGVVLFESRRATEMAALVTRHGGVPIAAPTMREVRLDDDGPAKAFGRDLVAGAFDVVVTMTGVGTRALVAAVQPEIETAALASALGRVTVVARGPKPVVALREIGVTAPVIVPEQNTHREVLGVLEARGLVGAGTRIAVLEHGAPTPELTAPLEAAGALVRTVKVYRHALVEDSGPLVAALERLASGEVFAALFTSRAQIELAAGVADARGIGDRVRATLRAGFVGSIGPVCTAGLAAEGIPPDLEPEHPKMGHLMKESAQRAGAILAAKKS